MPKIQKYRAAFSEVLKPLIQNLKTLPKDMQKEVLEKALIDASTKTDIKFDATESDAVLESPVSKRVKTLEDLIKETSIDLSEWEVEKHSVNKWEMRVKADDGSAKFEPLFQVKAFLKRKNYGIDINKFRSDLVEDLKKISPVSPRLSKKTASKEPSILEICIFDLHWGKLAWAEETGDNYDTKIARQRFLNAIQVLLDRTAGFEVERIVFPVGNDFFNSDYAHPFSRTTKGTPQEEDLRWQKTFREGRALILEGIEMMRAVAPVDVIIVPGNHDFERTFYLGDSLEGWYHNCDDVNIFNSAAARKYYSYGKCLIGYTHGNEEKVNDLPMLMAVEQPEAWANSKYREFHLGHFHSKKDIKYQSTKETSGVVLRWMRSLSGTDSWHAKKGYKGAIQSAEAFVWSKEEGVVGNFSTNM